MANWKQKIKLTDLIYSYDSSAADELIEIERIKPLWIERLSSISCLKQFIPFIKKVKTEAKFNKVISQIYDYCDDNLIWVE
jgi:hypothetical protein